MRIGVMLRSYDEQGGVGVFTRYAVQELIERDQDNEYVLLFRNPANLGAFSAYPHVTERVVKAPNKALWDQVAVPYACWREHIDVLFHPKFTVPLLAPCKSVMVLHGAGWFMPETRQYWSPADLKYLKLVMPLYCRRAAAVLAVSQITTDTFNDVFSLPAGKITTVYFGPGKHFCRIDDPAQLREVRHKYGLPDRYILTLSGYDRGARKNIGNIFKAYAALHGTVPHALVVGGKDCARFRDDYALPADGYGRDVVFPGWIDQEDLPAVYSMADLFLYPSFSEAFPIPLTEAMACGTPIVTSNLNGLREIAGDAAAFVDANDPVAIAEAVQMIVSDPERQQRLAARSLARSEQFSWARWAEQTLDILRWVGDG